MDAFYDTESAMKMLSEIQSKRTMEKKKEIQMRKLVKTEGWEDFFRVDKFNEPTCWRMTWAGEEDKEEVILHLQGVIEGKNLPPFQGEKNEKRLCFMRQTVTISGLGNAEFDESMEAMMDIYAKIARHIDATSGIETKVINGRSMVEIGSCIFTPKSDAPTLQWADIEPEIDRYGFISGENRVDSKFVYTWDNVIYYREERTKGDAKKTVAVGPEKFHIGDIVDVAFSMIAVESNKPGKAAKILTQLRFITLLDGTHAKSWIKAQAKAGTQKAKDTLLKKRRGMEDDENVEDTRNRFKRLRLDEVK